MSLTHRIDVALREQICHKIEKQKSWSQKLEQPLMIPAIQFNKTYFEDTMVSLYICYIYQCYSFLIPGGFELSQ